MTRGMEANPLFSELPTLRLAIQTLYLEGNDRNARAAADAWLQSFRQRPGAWRLCLSLLGSQLPDHEQYFAAHSLKAACQKSQELVTQPSLGEAVLSIHQRLKAALASRAWPVAGQLSSALASLAVRATCWEADALIPQLLHLLLPPLAHVLAGAAAGGAGAERAALSAQLDVDPVAVTSLLQVLAALPEACTTRHIALHPGRRVQVVAALGASPIIAPLLELCMVGVRSGRTSPTSSRASGSGSQFSATSMSTINGQMRQRSGTGDSLGMQASIMQQPQQHQQQSVGLAIFLAGGAVTGVTSGAASSQSCVLPNLPLGLKLFHAWCELGHVPAGLDQRCQVLQTLCNAVLQPAHASASSECLAAMIDACSGMVKKPKDVSHAAGRGAAATGNATGHGANMQGQPQSQSHRPLLSSPLPHLQHVLNMLSDFFYNALANHLPGVQKDQLIATHAQPSGNDGIAASSQSQPSPVADWSAMRAALPGLPVVLQQALAAVLCALGSGILGPALRGEGVYEAMFSQWVGPLLMELLGLEDADVTLTALGFWQDTYLAALLCLSGKRIVGHAQPLAAQLVVNAGSQPQLDEILAAHGPLLGSLMHALVLRSALTPAQAAYTSADARDLSEEVRMVRRELASALRDINGLVGQEHTLQYMWGLVGVTLASLNQQAAAAQSTAMSPQAHVRAWCQMECAVYAANVVLGRCDPASSSPHIGRLVTAAAECVRHPTGSMKLSGTALTLLGGMALWYAEQPEAALQPVLNAVGWALQQRDEKLTRNAATTVNRWVQVPAMAQRLLERHMGFVKGLLALLPGPLEVLKHTTSPGEDLSTAELLVASLTRLACVPLPLRTSQPSSRSLSRHTSDPAQDQMVDVSHQQVRSPSPASSQASGSRGVVPGARGNGSGMSATAASEILSLLLSPRADTACTRLQALLGQLAACAHELRQQQRMVMPDMGMGPMGQAYEILLRPSLAPAVQQQLNMAAWEAGRCVESLASILFFIPAPGNSVEDMGVHTQAGRERVHGGGRRGVGGDGHASSPTLSEVMREDVAMDVSDLVVQVLARLWAPLLQCLSLQLAQLSQSSPLLTAACTLLRAGLLIVPRRAHELLSLVQALISCTASSTVADVQSAPCIMTLLANCMPIISRVVSGTLAPTGSTSQRSSLSGQALPLSTQVVYSADVQVTAHGMAAVTRQLLLQASIQVAAQDSTSHDPDSIVALLHLASVCMAQMPQVLCDSQLLGSLSAATISAMQTFHGDQGRSVLAWTEALCTVGCAPPPAVGLHPSSITAGTTNGSGSRGGRGGRGGGRGNVPAAAVDLQDQAHASFTTRQPIYTQMAIMLHSGNVGPSLMLALLLAASGTMRSELMLPIAMCMHNIWHAVGSDCFWRWMSGAVMDASATSAPWARTRTEARVAFLREALAADCATDVLRFKRVLKTWCGGKKKAGPDSMLMLP